MSLIVVFHLKYSNKVLRSLPVERSVESLKEEIKACTSSNTPWEYHCDTTEGWVSIPGANILYICLQRTP